MNKLLEKRLNHLREIEQSFKLYGNAECADIYHGAVTELEITLKEIERSDEENEKRDHDLSLAAARITALENEVDSERLRLQERIGNLERENKRLIKVLDFRNDIEGQAHALFTDAFSDGTRIMHTPDTCDPLGFVKLLKERVEKEIKERDQLRAQVVRLREALTELSTTQHIPGNIRQAGGNELARYGFSVKQIADKALSETPADAAKQLRHCRHHPPEPDDGENTRPSRVTA